MQLNSKVKNELLELRDRLRKEFIIDGNTSKICSDKAVEEIANKLPQSIEEFKNINTVGTIFIERHAELFLDIIKEIQQEEMHSEKVQLKPQIIKTLNHLQQQLIKINRRNRMLYFPRIRKRDSIDLFSEAKKPDFLDRLLNGSRLKIFNRDNTPESQQKYKEANTVFRAVNSTLRETGKYNIYIGYPFVIGRSKDEDFDFRAPLALIPIRIIRESDYFQIQFDKDRDIVFNNHFIVANNKFSEVNKVVDDHIYNKNGSWNDFLEQTISYYEKHQIVINHEYNILEPLKEYKSSEFPKYDNGEYDIQHSFVMGQFDVHSNAIARDFESIIENENINKLLDNLLSGINNDRLDYSFGGYEYDERKQEEKELNENDITYINSLNTSQEKVLKRIEEVDALVVEGPPGTGKSQMITSLITDSIIKNRSVLLVSEKKAALDVVYSRLGILSDKAIIVDDINNKQSFYEKLVKILKQSDQKKYHLSDIKTISDEIESYITNLKMISSKMYSNNNFGLPVYKSYKSRRLFDLENDQVIQLFDYLEEVAKINFSDILFQDLDDLYNFLKRGNYSTQLIFLLEKFLEYDWLHNLRTNISEIDINRFKREYKNSIDKIKDVETKGFLQRSIIKLIEMNKINQSLKVIFNKVPKKNILTDNLQHERNILIESLDSEDKLLNAYNIFQSLRENEKNYIEIVEVLAKEFNLSVEDANEYLFNYFLIKEVIHFEKNNSQVLSFISSFDGTINRIKNLMIEKQEITKMYLYSLLDDKIKKEILWSKNAADITSRIQSRRKWGINKFIKTYQQELFNGIKIWMMTPEVVSEILPDKIGLIDLVIFDEASQMYIERGVPAIYRAKKVVVAGDSKQLKPSSLGSGRLDYYEELEMTEGNIDNVQDSIEALEEESLLDVAKIKYYPPTSLDFHYRSKYMELINFSNYAFYGGRLKVSPNTSTPMEPPIQYIKVDGLWSEQRNSVEAERVVTLVDSILQNRKENETIGIITFNAPQKEEILDQIEDYSRTDIEFSIALGEEENRKENGEDVSFFVKNIENVQGDERDIIIFSIGYGKDINGRVKTNFGWLSQKGGENRLNVAITRARKKIYIVSSIYGEDLDVSNAKNEGPKTFREYLRYAYAISENQKDAAKSILHSFSDTGFSGIDEFDSDFEAEVYSALIDIGFNVETQIGVGGYRIDMAIKKDNHYILGIECDGKLYHSSKSARERDIHRQQYLESRGWIIHRIWSKDWWKNPGNEIEKIASKINNIQNNLVSDHQFIEVNDKGNKISEFDYFHNKGFQPLNEKLYIIDTDKKDSISKDNLEVSDVKSVKQEETEKDESSVRTSFDLVESSIKQGNYKPKTSELNNMDKVINEDSSHNSDERLDVIFNFEKKELDNKLGIIKKSTEREQARYNEHKEAHRYSIEVLEKKYALAELNKSEEYLKELDKIYKEPYFLKINAHEISKNETRDVALYIGENDFNFQGNRIIYGWQYQMAHHNSNKLNNTYEVKIDKITKQYTITSERRIIIKDSELIKVYEDSIRGKNDNETVIDPFLLDIIQEKRNIPEITNIIKTIQDEQIDLIISPLETNMIVQGVAGSGKTMIMFHRLSYLLYHNHNLKPDQVQIVVPNKKFINQMMPLIKNLTLEKTPIISVFNFYKKMLNYFNYTFSYRHSDLYEDQLEYSEDACVLLDNELVELCFTKDFRQLFNDEEKKQLENILKIFKDEYYFVGDDEYSYKNLKGNLIKIRSIMNHLNQDLSRIYREKKLRSEDSKHINAFIDVIHEKKTEINKFLRDQNDRLRSFEEFVESMSSLLNNGTIYDVNYTIEYSKLVNYRINLKNITLYLSLEKNMIKLLDFVNNQLEQQDIKTGLPLIKLSQNQKGILVEMINKVKNSIGRLNITVNEQKGRLSELEIMISKINAGDYSYYIKQYSDYFDHLDERVSNFLVVIDADKKSEKLKLNIKNKKYFNHFIKNIKEFKQLKKEIDELHGFINDDDLIIKRYFDILEIRFNPAYRDHLYLVLNILQTISAGIEMPDDKILTFIDEGQDYTSEEFNLFKKIWKKSVFNIYGDLNQALRKDINIKTWEEIIDDKTAISELNQNYRNTFEVTEFTNRQLGLKMQPIGLNGNEPENLSFLEFIDLIKSVKINKKDRVAIILPMSSNHQLQELLQEVVKENLKEQRIDLMNVFQSKGLEYEIVFVFNQEMTTEEKYVAYTRALKELYIVSSNLS